MLLLLLLRKLSRLFPPTSPHREKDLMKQIVKRLQHKNPNVVMRTLSVSEYMSYHIMPYHAIPQLREMIVKNCGSTVHQEIATPDFMNTMKQIIKVWFRMAV